MTIFEDTAPQGDRHRPLRVAILGCSGSIGTQALDVCRQHPDELDVVALSVNSSLGALVKAAREFDVKQVAVAESARAADPVLDDLPKGCQVHKGERGVTELCRLPEVDCVLDAVVGEEGIWAAYTALEEDKILACANKEAFVSGGDLLMPMAKPGRLLPIDSEHAAIYQCLTGQRSNEIYRIWLTCSGGPFYGWTREELETVTPRMALSHPTWHMGPKISIDSATLMNKGLEVIEAHHLFQVGIDDVYVLIHRQSKIHSLVEFCDGSTMAQLGASDMRIPIQYALSYPDRWDTPADRIDYRRMHEFTFAKPDLKTFRCFDLALTAGRTGGTMPCAMNAANEVANLAFRRGRIGFCDIDRTIERVMEQTEVEPVQSLEQLADVDARARERAGKVIDGIQR